MHITLKDIISENNLLKIKNSFISSSYQPIALICDRYFFFIK